MFYNCECRTLATIKTSPKVGRANQTARFKNLTGIDVHFAGLMLL